MLWRDTSYTTGNIINVIPCSKYGKQYVEQAKQSLTYFDGITFPNLPPPPPPPRTHTHIHTHAPITWYTIGRVEFSILGTSGYVVLI